jgi:hypothetical protein
MSDIDWFKEAKENGYFNPKTGLKDIIFSPEEGDFFLIGTGGIYLIQIILVSNSFIRIKFVETASTSWPSSRGIPKEFENQCVGDKEVWVPKKFLTTNSFVEKLNKEDIRKLKINSLGV